MIIRKKTLRINFFGGGFTGRTLEEIGAIVKGLKKNHPDVVVIQL